MDTQDLIEETKKKEFREYCKNFNILRIMRAGFWDDDNAIYCEKCKAQVNYWKNPFSDLSVFVNNSFSSCEILQEDLYNRLSLKEKLLFEKCDDCFIYTKIGAEIKQINHSCTCKKKIFKFLNGVIQDEDENEEN